MTEIEAKNSPRSNQAPLPIARSQVPKYLALTTIVGLMAVFAWSLSFPWNLLGLMLSFVLLMATVTRGLGRRRIDLSIEGSGDSPLHAIDARARSIKILKSHLSKLRFEENVDSLAERAFDQFERFILGTESANTHVNARFSRGEITHSRYAQAVERVYEGVIENFNDLQMVLQSLNGTDFKSVSSRLNSLDATSSEAVTLNEQLKSRELLIKRFDALIAMNESTLTELNRMSTALNVARTEGATSEAELELALGELKLLSDRAHLYSQS